MKTRYAHIIIDEKFIEGAVSLFETDDRVENHYFMIDRKTETRYLKKIKIEYLTSENAVNVINSYDAVIIHSLPSIPLFLVENIKKHVKVVWLAWGYDMYEKPYDIIPVKLLGEETHKNTKIIRFLARYYWKNVKKRKIVHQYLKSALSRIDYFSGVFPYEIDLIKANRPEFKAKPLDFYYGSATDFFIPEVPETVIKHGKNNIIIGNSANITGNHLDVLKTLSSIQLESVSKIIIPLSYGDVLGYAKKVENKAQILAPGKIVSLKQFMPLEQYLALISNCRSAFFAHERQQASDNIFMQLLFGARVFMSESSAAYHYLKNIGIKVFSIQNDMDLVNVELEDDDVMTNRRILSEHYSTSKLINRIKVINNTIISELENEK